MAPRLQVPFLGEHYNDMLQIEAWIKDRSAPAEAQSLLCSALMRREAARNAIIERLAAKRGMTPTALMADILLGKASQLSQEDYAELQQEMSEEQGS